MENKIDKLVLGFDELFKKIIDRKEQFSDFKRFRNKLIKRLKESSHK